MVARARTDRYGRAQGVIPVPQCRRDRITLPDVLDRAEPVPLQQGRHVVRGQEREPRLAALRGRGSDQVSVDVAGVTAQGGGEDVVGDELRSWREPADLGERLADRGPGRYMVTPSQLTRGTATGRTRPGPDG
jgi:hypothetical protein